MDAETAGEYAAAAAAGAEPEPEPEPEPEEGEPVGPLDAKVLVVLTADGEDGELISFRALAQKLREASIDGGSRVFVPPADMGEARAVGELVDMEEVKEMDDEDVGELAASLRDQLTPEEVRDEAPDQEGTLVVRAGDEIDRACAACAPPLDLASLRVLRCPLELPAPLAAQAERQLGETPEVRAAAIAELRERVVELEKTGVGKKKKTRPIAFPRKDDEFLCAFLRCKKFRVDDALKSVIKYTDFVHEFAEVLGSLNAEGEPMMDPKNQALIGLYTIKSTTNTGGRMICFRMAELPIEMLRKIDPKIHADIMYKQGIRFMLATFCRILSDPHAAVCGVAMCEDWADAPPLKLVMRLDNAMSTKQKKVMYSLFSDIIPMRLNAVMILNQPAWFTVVLSLVKPFLSKKLRKRIYLLKHDYQRFHSLIDPAVLPTCFKGSVDWGPIREKEQAAAGGTCTFEDIGIASEQHSDETARPYSLDDAPCMVQ